MPLGAYMAATAACSAPSVFTHVYLGNAAGDLSSLLSSGHGGFAGFLQLCAPVFGLLVLGQWLLRLLPSLVQR